MKKTDRLMKLSDAAKLAGVPAFKLRDDRARGIIKAERDYVGAHWQYRESEVKRYAKTIKRESK